MSQLSLGFQALCMCSLSMNALESNVDRHAQCTGNTSREAGTVRRTARRPHFSLAIMSVTVQLRIQVFLVISVYFNLRNILPKSGTFSPGHPIYNSKLTKYINLMSSKLFCKYVLYSETNITLKSNVVQKCKKLRTPCTSNSLDIKLL